MIPAKHAEFFWREDERGALVDLLVLDRRERRARGFPPVPKARFPNSGGACNTEWMTGNDDGLLPAALRTPEGFFVAQVIDRPAADYRTRVAVMGAFAEIEECAWARRMLAALIALGPPVPGDF